LDTLLVADFDEPAAADYVAHVAGHALGEGRLQRAELADESSFAGLRSALGTTRVGEVVLFLGKGINTRGLKALDELLVLLGRQQVRFVALVSTYRVHLGDEPAARAEAVVLERVNRLRARTLVFRPGHIVSPSSRAAASLRRFGFCTPLIPHRLRGCCVAGEELFAAIESERRAPASPRSHTLTLLGPNRPWRDLLRQHRSRTWLAASLTVAAFLLALTQLGRVAGLVLDLLARRRPALRRWNLHTLRPRSLAELLALYNRHNYGHVKVVGYNNGVIHFGHRYPGKTVVSTVHCDRVVRTAPDEIKADCGATIRKALDFLAGDGQELYVIPNYSYVCLGTAYFVPIHGSAADFSTVAETITRAILYDPVRDRLLVTSRAESAFRHHLYNLDAEVLLLRLWVRVKPRSRYFIRREELEAPASGELLEALRDTRATNVEIRKSSAAGTRVRVCKYYNDPGAASSAVLELPRDALGRLWDRLEENPVTSFLMHALTRHFAWHVELFFTEEEFARFWADHRDLPLRKIQLRYIHRDGFPNSPFREHDCVSADMFMLRRHRRKFEDYLKRTFAVVRSNPGKHSK
jgi:hypothetical protein